MKHKSLIIIVLFFTACKAKPELEKTISAWEATTNQQTLTKVQISDSTFNYYYSDSAEILKSEMKKFAVEKIEELQFQLRNIEKRLANIRVKIENETSPLMQKAMQTKEHEVLIELKKINRIIAIYNTQPEITQIGWYQQQIENYENCSEKVIGIVVTAHYQLENKAQITQQYLVDTNLQTVICKMQ